jgi:hypothetical protein
MCGLCLFVHVVKYTIIVAKAFIVVAKRLRYHPSMDAIKIGLHCSLFIYILNESHIRCKL